MLVLAAAVQVASRQSLLSIDINEEGKNSPVIRHYSFC